MAHLDESSDSPLTPQQHSIVSALDAEFVEKVDAELLANTNEGWRKVAMVVGLTMMNESLRRPGLPDLYYAARIRELVRSGALEAAGDLSQMRHCEVRRA